MAKPTNATNAKATNAKATNYAATGIGPAPLMPASVKRGYAKALPAAFAARVVTLNTYGQSVAKAGGIIPATGKQTVMGIMAWAAGIAAGKGNSATGAQIVSVVLTNKAVLAALSGTKANGVHIGPNCPPCPLWVKGYIVSGICGKAAMAS